MSVRQHTLAPNTAFATPYYVINSHKSGPVFMIVSGIHGNEPASIAAAQALAGKFERSELTLGRGRLIIVPLVNQRAYRRKSRGVPDLNRTFPHAASSGPDIRFLMPFLHWPNATVRSGISICMRRTDCHSIIRGVSARP